MVPNLRVHRLHGSVHSEGKGTEMTSATVPHVSGTTTGRWWLVPVLVLTLAASACTSATANDDGGSSTTVGGDQQILATDLCPSGAITNDDRDGDGIDDAAEAAGWVVIVTDGNGVGTNRTASSSPTSTDTDNDGRCDSAERLDGTDPAAADTDGDGLDDRAELETWGSSPLAVDTDGDSRANPRLFDGSEATELGTSPTLADTDGDAIDDYVEVIERGEAFHPLIANVPQMELTLAGETSITLDAVRTEDSSRVETIETGLVQSTERTTSSTDTQTLGVWDESSHTVGVEAEASYPKAFSVKGSYEYSTTSGYSNEQQSSFTDSSTQATQRRYDRALELSRSEGVQLNGGTLAIGVQISNVGDVSFELTDLSVTVLKRRADNPIAFSTVQTLTLALDRSVILAPGQESSVLRASGDIPVDVALELMRNPGALSFESSFDLTNAEGHSFAFLAEHTNSQTALMTIDYGNGSVLRRRVATNVQRVDGATGGITVADALALLSVAYETTPNDVGTPVLTSMTDASTGATMATDQDGSGFWAVIGSDGVAMDAATAFDEIVLSAGESLTVMFVQDRDGDGLYLRQETRYGTSDESIDSDGDGISDYEEVSDGWSVSLDMPPYPATVYSDPAAADRDGDGLDDPTERGMGTDPNSRDTDGDGFCDGPGISDCLEDPEQLVAAVNNAPNLTVAETGKDGLTVTVQIESSDNDFGDEVLLVHIDWGDGNVEELPGGSQTVTHKYGAPGSFTVSVRADDSYGLSSTAGYVANVEPKVIGADLQLTVQRVTIGEICGEWPGQADIFGDITVNGEAAFAKGRGSAVGVWADSDIPLDKTIFTATDIYGDGEAPFRIVGEVRDADNPAWGDPDDGMGRWNFTVTSVGVGSRRATDGEPCSLATITYNVTVIREITELG